MHALCLCLNKVQTPSKLFMVIGVRIVGETSTWEAEDTFWGPGGFSSCVELQLHALISKNSSSFTLTMWVFSYMYSFSEHSSYKRKHRNNFKDVEPQKHKYNKTCAVTVVKCCLKAKDIYIRMSLAHL